MSEQLEQVISSISNVCRVPMCTCLIPERHIVCVYHWDQLSESWRHLVIHMNAISAKESGGYDLAVKFAIESLGERTPF